MGDGGARYAGVRIKTYRTRIQSYRKCIEFAAKLQQKMQPGAILNKLFFWKNIVFLVLRGREARGPKISFGAIWNPFGAILGVLVAICFPARHVNQRGNESTGSAVPEWKPLKNAQTWTFYYRHTLPSWTHTHTHTHHRRGGICAPQCGFLRDSRFRFNPRLGTPASLRTKAQAKKMGTGRTRTNCEGVQ